MKKTKFQINKMHCNSCSGLIEDKLKEQDGIVSAKVSYDSGKASIVYDENKIQEDSIKKVIESAGDYTAEKINKNLACRREPCFRQGKNINYENNQNNMSNNDQKENSKGNFVSGIAIGAAIMAVLAFVVVPNLSSNNGKGEVDLGAQIEDTNNEDSYVAPTPTPTVIDIEVSSDDHIRGNANADITIVEYSDFQCPYCSRFHTTMQDIIEDFGDDIRWVYKHFPLDSIHPYARKAAEASECASDQNKFWEYNDELFANQSRISDSFLAIAAGNIGLNVQQFNECLDSDKYADKVENDYQEGIGFGVRGTPGGFINGVELGGAVPYSTLERAINELL
ncbi:MAG: thioredoxin domain-containing protein [Parcubacteria group bacterium]|nr:thioredoxin domain-containing protein [Parcubacteria group bacterium]